MCEVIADSQLGAGCIQHVDAYNMFDEDVVAYNMFDTDVVTFNMLRI